MMTIVHLTSVHPRYDSRIFFKECLTLVKAGYCVKLVVADGLGHSHKEGIEIYDVGYPKNRVSRMLLTAYKIFRLMAQWLPSAVHFHDPELLWVAVLLKRLGIKVIYDVHEDMPRKLLEKAWLPTWSRSLVARAFCFLENRAVLFFDAIVVTTETIQERLLRSNKPVITLFNYPLLSEFTKPTFTAKRKNQICYVGSISKNRGIEALIDAVTIAKIKLALAGLWSEPTLRDELMQKKGWCWVAEKGVLNRKEVQHLLATSKIGCVTLFPTPTYQEALPIKLFEYMAAGLPVIASDFPLLKKIVKDAQCGVVVDPTNPQAIASAIENLLRDERALRKMGRFGRAAVVKKYDWEHQAKKLLSLYKKLLPSYS